MKRTGSNIALLLLSFPFAQSAAGADGAETRWPLDRALSLPDGLSMSGTYRVRYESIDNNFRASSVDSDHILVQRLLFSTVYNAERFYAGFELQDARQQLADAPVGTDIVNALEPLQAFVGARLRDVWKSGDRLDLGAGRLTIDAGSRRLVARNRFRNTLNAFTGVRGVWQPADGAQLQAFYVLPVDRRPNDAASLQDNEAQLDTQSSDTQLWGAIGSRAHVFGSVTGEAYVFGLQARDHGDVQVGDRRIYTPGFRLYRKASVRDWDFEIEGAYQFGRSRLTTSATDTRTLDHAAGFLHGEIGYTTGTSWATRLEISYDYASGDSDPADGENNRFDILYGARRFDLGPTGTYGAIVRSNISSPGLRIQVLPTQHVAGFLGYRAVWLASGRDQYSTARLQDPSGHSGKFVGQQIEWQLQWTLVPGNLVLEFGGAHLFDGSFLRKAPRAPASGDTSYLYGAVMLTF